MMDFLNLLKHCYRLTRASFHKVQMYLAYRYQHVTRPIYMVVPASAVEGSYDVKRAQCN